jgi:hypothetical protein
MHLIRPPKDISDAVLHVESSLDELLSRLTPPVLPNPVAQRESSQGCPFYKELSAAHSIMARSNPR